MAEKDRETRQWATDIDRLRSDLAAGQKHVDKIVKTHADYGKGEVGRYEHILSEKSLACAVFEVDGSPSEVIVAFDYDEKESPSVKILEKRVVDNYKAKFTRVRRQSPGLKASSLAEGAKTTTALLMAIVAVAGLAGATWLHGRNSPASSVPEKVEALSLHFPVKPQEDHAETVNPSAIVPPVPVRPSASADNIESAVQDYLKVQIKPLVSDRVYRTIKLNYTLPLSPQYNRASDTVSCEINGGIRNDDGDIVLAARKFGPRSSSDGTPDQMSKAACLAVVDDMVRAVKAQQ